MTEIEFEAKLATVTDAKLLMMLAASRRDGPEIAVKMILSEAKSRGLEDLEANLETAPAVPDVVEENDTDADAEIGEEMPPTNPNWLNEENGPKKMPMVAKAFLFLAALGALIVCALKFIQRG